MVIAKHLEEIVQHEERGQIERLDVLELDQQLQKALPNSQAPIEKKRPELADVGEQNFVDQPILQQFDESLRFIAPTNQYAETQFADFHVLVVHQMRGHVLQNHRRHRHRQQFEIIA